MVYYDPKQQQPKRAKGSSWPTAVTVMLVLGWAALFGAMALPLLAAIQVAAAGLGAMCTAVVIALLDGPRKK